MQESIPAPEEAAIAEHVCTGRVQGPVVALASRSDLSGDLDEAVVEAEIVPDRVLPGRPLLAVVRKVLYNVLADVAQRQHVAGGLRDGHGYQRDVRVGRLGVLGVGAALLSASSLLPFSLAGLVGVYAVAVFLRRRRGLVRAAPDGLGLALRVRVSHWRWAVPCRRMGSVQCCSDSAATLIARRRNPFSCRCRRNVRQVACTRRSPQRSTRV